MRTLCGTILAAAVTMTFAVGVANGGDSVPDCDFEDFHGHKLDRKALELLRRH